ncbi:S1C family serine protease [Gillisia sp. CAL575]|uniref:S1C family serine protease n=1 Tax=Gillisia sp. CAL575 TaxID=985255 RepID=UPI000399FC32|nr:serine protease [Gillisia sp. CAL575]
MNIKIIFQLSLLLYFSYSFGQETTTPYVLSTNTPNCIINNVTVDNNSTKIMMTYWKTKSDAYQAWVSFSSNTFIIDTKTNERFQIKSLHNLQGRLELNQRYSTKGRKGKVGEKNTTIYVFGFEFPPLPSGVENIDIVEEINGEYGFVWRGIKINNPDKSISSNWNENKIKTYWNSNGIDPIEGIYENTVSSQTQSKYKIAIKKNGQNYEAIYLDGADNSKWNEGDIKALITTTASPNIYATDWYMSNKVLNENVYTSFEPGIMRLIWTDNSPESLYLKLYPTNSDELNISNSTKSSGTGFALSSNGYIVTNYHVTNGAKKITVKGIKGDFFKSFNAKVIIEDKNNDLSIIKIEDPKFTTLGIIPYKIDNNTSDVGNSVYALGYPLRATMGDEVKLTNGIISSKTGFQGDITSYQTSVPVQSGNSGGPLFDSRGNVIAIINAKHLDAENASYAIKTSYLNNLIQSMNNRPTLSTNNQLSSELSEQVKFIKEFIYIIEIN